MSTDAHTPQSRPVLQVGPLKPSLAQTLQDDYAAYVLPDEPPNASVSVVARRGDHGGGDVGAHGCGRRR